VQTIIGSASINIGQVTNFTSSVTTIIGNTTIQVGKVSGIFNLNIGGFSGNLTINQFSDNGITSDKIAGLAASKITAGTISATVLLTAPTLNISNGNMHLFIDNYNGILFINTGLRVQITQDSSITANAGLLVTDSSLNAAAVLSPGIIYARAAMGGPASIIAMQAGTGSAGGIYGPYGTRIISNQRQIGPGSPSFGSLANAQSWCQSLLTALQTHGLVS
jgi:thiamine phosphate synthase YjbQ (UPF0047 family)